LRQKDLNLLLLDRVESPGGSCGVWMVLPKLVGKLSLFSKETIWLKTKRYDIQINGNRNFYFNQEFALL
jgi:hypothetical protein